MEAYPLQGSRFLVEHPRLPRDEDRPKPRRIKVGDGEQGVLLRPAQLQLRDDVCDRRGHYYLRCPREESPATTADSG